MNRPVFWHSWFRHAKINQKLTLLSMVSSLAALSLTGFSLMALDLAAQKKNIEENLSIISKIIGSNCSAAILFDDSKSAHETLSGLAAHPQIESAAIYDRSGRIFATFKKDSEQEMIPIQVPIHEHSYKANHVTLTSLIIFQNDPIGSVFIRFNLNELKNRLVTDLAIVGLITLLSFIISIYFSSKLKNMTSMPILHLAAVARQVTLENNYALRATKQSEDELGKLTDDFNQMLREVQYRDEQKSAAEKKFSFLAEASTILARSLDYQKTLEEVGEISIPYLGDECVFDLTLPSGSLSTLIVPQKNHTALINEKTQRFRQEVMKMAHLICTESVLSIPLIARGNILGAMTFYSMNATRRYSNSEINVAEDLARRASFAIDNARLYREAEEAIRLRDEFIAIASHELKTPLATLQLQFQAVMKKATQGQLFTLSEERINEMQASTQRQFQKFSKLISDLLDVSRLSTGKTRLELEPLDLTQLVHEVIDEISPELQRVRCVVTLEADSPIYGQWDRIRIQQAISNLVTNAAKYGAGKPIHISVHQKEETAVISVKDFGIGIAPHDQVRIFDRFERAVSRRHFGGFGLGLYITQQNIAAHGGKIWVESTPGQGSKFTIEVPLKFPTTRNEVA